MRDNPLRPASLFRRFSVALLGALILIAASAPFEMSAAQSSEKAPLPAFPSTPDVDAPSRKAPEPPTLRTAPEAPAPADRRYIEAQEFRDAFENKTVHLTSGGLHYGSEYYLPGDRSVWIGAGGPCRRGEWAYRGDLFCFSYGPDGPHCWRVFESGGDYFAESLEGLVLRIYSVEERPLNCDPGLFS